MPSSSTSTTPAPATISGPQLQTVPAASPLTLETQEYSVYRPSGERKALSALQLVPRAQLDLDGSAPASTVVSNSATTIAPIRSSSDSPAPLPRLRRHSSLRNELKEEDIKLEKEEKEDEVYTNVENRLENEEGGFDIFEDPNGSKCEFVMPSSDGGVKDSELEGASGNPQKILDYLEAEEADGNYSTSRQTSEAPFTTRSRAVRLQHDEVTAQLLRSMLSPELCFSPPSAFSDTSFRAGFKATTVYGDENQTPPPLTSIPSRHPPIGCRPVYETLRH